MPVSAQAPESTARRASRHIQPLPRPLRILIVISVFTIAGPPIGGLVAWLTMGARGLNSPVPFVTGAYAEAVTLAFGVGVVVGVASLAGWMSAVVPFLAALLINFVMFAVTGSLSFSSFDPDTLFRVAYVFIPPSLVASMVCWLLTRGLLRP
jgi:hypothetical protein